MTINYKPKGVCSREIKVEIEDGIVKDVCFVGGCAGNTQGLSALCKGRKACEVVDLLKDIKCGFKNTSCPAQLALAIKEAQNKE